MKLGTSNKATALADQWRATHNVKRVDRLDEENDRLRAELRMTRSQLEREREREQDVLDALNRASERKTKVTAKPRGGLLRLVIVGGTAYVFGTKAGRERYEQMRTWFSSMKDRLTDPTRASSIPRLPASVRSRTRSRTAASGRRRPTSTAADPTPGLADRTLIGTERTSFVRP